MKDRKIQQLGTPSEIYLQPANQFVAGFVGSPRMNFIEGHIERLADGLAFTAGKLRLPLGGYPFAGARTIDQPAVLGVRPEHIAVNGSGLWSGFRSELVEMHGADNLVWSSDGAVWLQLRLPGDQFPPVGSQLSLTPDAERISLFDVETGERL
jgi:multiple sugar transport system ATP-binding protein